MAIHSPFLYGVFTGVRNDFSASY